MRPFDRGLCEPFMAALQAGPGARVLTACRERGLDLRLRDDYLNVYDLGRSVARITWRARRGPKLDVHRWYLEGAPLRPATAATGRNGLYPAWDLTDELVDLWLASLSRLHERAEDRAGPEDRWENLLQAESPERWVDRQVQPPGRGRKADLLGVEHGVLVIGEVKAGSNSDIQHGPQQLATYMDMLAPGGRLRQDVAGSYRTVAAQLRRLGFPAPEPSSFSPGQPVRGELILCDYPHHRPELARRAGVLAEELPHELSIVWRAG